MRIIPIMDFIVEREFCLRFGIGTTPKTIGLSHPCSFKTSIAFHNHYRFPGIKEKPMLKCDPVPSSPGSNNTPYSGRMAQRVTSELIDKPALKARKLLQSSQKRK